MITGQANQYEYTNQTSLYYELMVKNLGEKKAKRYWKRRDDYLTQRLRESEDFLNRKDCKELNKAFDKFIRQQYSWKKENINSWNNLGY